MTALRTQSLQVTLPGGFRLGPLSFTTARGSRTAILGPSGCGKTTLLRCLAGLQTPDQGSIHFGERVLCDGTASTPPHLRRVGYVFQDSALWPHLTALQHLRFVDPGLSKAGARELLAQVGLEDRWRRRPATLSGGEAQRLALARALASAPELLLLDEPLSSIDVPLRDELGLLIDRLCHERGLTLVVVTHDRFEALALADHLLVLRDGRLVESGPAVRILRQPETGFGASYVAGATCLPASPTDTGLLETPLGTFPRPAGCEGPAELVLMPGDLAIAARGHGAGQGRVVRVVPTPEGATAAVAIAGHVVPIPCPETTARGASLPLVLAGPPRILPTEKSS